MTQCLNYQKVKVESSRPKGLVQSFDVPKWKWNSIYGFCWALPLAKAEKSKVWVIVDRLTKTRRFIPMN